MKRGKLVGLRKVQSSFLGCLCGPSASQTQKTRGFSDFHTGKRKTTWTRQQITVGRPPKPPKLTVAPTLPRVNVARQNQAGAAALDNGLVDIAINMEDISSQSQNVVKGPPGFCDKWKMIAIFQHKFHIEYLFWNSRCVASNDFFSVLFDLLCMHKPSILILVDKKVHSSATHIIVHKSHFNKFIVIEAHGFSGGIWVFWNDALLNLEVLSIHDKIITTAIKVGTSVSWVLSAVYASSKVAFRKLFWYYSELLGACLDLPWLLLDDWN
ncbi:hypothetical protein M9H77_13024 [Catharanthus roseus]|uniref:Uncharacterized protein n=1 Tax=Catharanthus roseus TaxID=4058 RepID=A0ACC0BJ61_CATRO|nr:hypothetical protein M9H77_13024 [Catharanthus roseus]